MMSKIKGLLKNLSLSHIFAAVVFLCLAALLFAAKDSDASQTFDPQTVRGPRVEKICMVNIANPDAQILAAEKGDIDILSDITRPSDIDILSKDPKLSMSLARAFHAFFLLLNTKSVPWKDKYVRQAAAEAIDRNNIVRTIFSGYCEPINGWLPPVSPWALPESTKNIYDRAAARAKLKKHGYTWNRKGTLVMPDGRPLEKMKLLTPLARVAPTTAELAEQIADSLRAIGMPVEVEPMDFSAMIAKMDRKEYSLAVMAWSMGRNPDSLYSFYHSSMSFAGGYNMTGISDKKLDAALTKLRFAKNRAEAKKASDESQRLLEDLVPSVPIYSRFSVAAVSKKWKNIITTDKMTADNIWTIMMAEPKNGKKQIMNMLLAEDPRNLNPFVASSAYSWQILGMLYEGMIDTNPFTLQDMPGLAASWSVNTAGSVKSAHTVLTFKIKRGLKWNDGSGVTAEDIAATIDFLRKNKVPRYFDSVKNIRSVRSFGDGRLVVEMSGTSYWYLDNVGGLPCMPKRVIQKIKDWQNWNPADKNNRSGPYGFVGTGPFMFEEYRQGEYVMLRRNPHYRRLEGDAR